MSEYLLLTSQEWDALHDKICAAFGYPDEGVKTYRYADKPEPDKDGLYEMPITSVGAPKLAKRENPKTAVLKASEKLLLRAHPLIRSTEEAEESKKHADLGKG